MEGLTVEYATLQAINEGYEVVICDTSGRLHTNTALMDELAKCHRAIGRRLPNAPHETLLVLDGTTGTALPLSQPPRGCEHNDRLLRHVYAAAIGQWCAVCCVACQGVLMMLYAAAVVHRTN